jgi:hypothetical protein
MPATSLVHDIYFNVLARVIRLYREGVLSFKNYCQICYPYPAPPKSGSTPSITINGA